VHYVYADVCDTLTMMCLENE